MSRFRNDTGSVLTVNDLMRQVGPGEEFEWPGHDVKVHGLVAGCTWLDAPQDGTDPAAAKKPAPRRGTAADSSKESSE